MGKYQGTCTSIAPLTHAGNLLVDGAGAEVRGEAFAPSQHQVWSWLRSIGGDRKTFRIKGKVVKVWSVPTPEFYEEETLTIETGLLS